jgi:hypothetical protein
MAATRPYSDVALGERKGPLFLELPEKLRNEIYGHCLKNNDSLRINCYPGKEHKRGSQSDLAIRPFTSLFLLCRTVSAEAASIYYSKNRFLITKDSCYKDETGRYFGIGAMEWIQEIGSQASLVRTLEIDLGGLCPQGCESSRRPSPSIDFAPLLRYVWKDNPNVTVSVVKSEDGYFNKNRTRHGDEFEEADFECNVTNISNIFCTIRYDTNLEALSEQLCTVMIRRDGSGGSLRYRPQLCSNTATISKMLFQAKNRGDELSFYAARQGGMRILAGTSRSCILARPIYRDLPIKVEGICKACRTTVGQFSNIWQEISSLYSTPIKLDYRKFLTESSYPMVTKSTKLNGW